MKRILGDMDIRRVKFLIIYGFQLALFICLCNIGIFRSLFHVRVDRFEHKLYSFANALLIAFQTTFSNICSIQMNINPYFFSTKLALIYYSLVVIAMIYTWHQTVRLSSCFFALLVITIIIFGTDLVLISDIILFYSYMMCSLLFFSFAALKAIYIPENIEITLYTLYEPNMSLTDWYKFLQNDTSICAYFCRWVKRTKKKWNIEEKLIISTIVGLITCIITIILCVYDLRSE
jgi:hypothetical protein